MFAGLEFFDALGRQAGLRAALLCVLYDRRRKKPSKPSLSIRHIDSIIQATNDELNFALFYLKQRGLVVGDDKSNLQISVDGMDFLERDQPTPNMVFPFIKPSALSLPAGSIQGGSIPVGSVSTESIQALSILADEPASAPAPRVVPSRTPVDPAAAEVESVLKVLTRALARR
jgi:hypothetical protein